MLYRYFFANRQSYSRTRVFRVVMKLLKNPENLAVVLLLNSHPIIFYRKDPVALIFTRADFHQRLLVMVEFQRIIYDMVKKLYHEFFIRGYLTCPVERAGESIKII